MTKENMHYGSLRNSTCRVKTVTEISSNLFFLDIGFFVLPLFLVDVFSGLEMISWSVVSVACYLMSLVLAICEFRHVSF